MIGLPIDDWLPRIRDSLARHPNLVLQAEPGAGKTTRVPPALLGEGMVLVLEPRRLAARLAASRVAEERGEKLGATVGYQVRFEAAMSSATRLLYLTEGLLLRRLQSDPTLAQASVVVLDEFHERHLAGDVSLAICRRLQRTVRPDLRIVVMSATIEAEPVAAWLGDAPVLSVPGRTFPLRIEFQSQPDNRSIEAQVRETAARALREQAQGDLLVFLPGAREIRRSQEACQGLDASVRPLHGDMPLEEQRAAILPERRRKIVLATNVAESSITIENVRTVIDSGLARIPTWSHWSGLSRLAIERVSQASATQRAGRAGRTGPGLVFRLYPRADFDLRPAFETPEILRSDLAETVLELHAAGIESGALEWFEAPPPEALSAAHDLLARLGALAPTLTGRGRAMASLPVHPRLAALVLAGRDLGVGRDAAVLAALLSYRDILSEARGLATRQAATTQSHSDLLYRYERYRSGRDEGLDRATVSQVRRLAERLQQGMPPCGTGDVTTPLLQATLAAFPDRVAWRPRLDRPTLLLSGGGSAELAPGSVVRSPWLVALDAEERLQGGRTASVLVRMGSEVDPSWLFDRYFDSLREETEIRYNESNRRVESVQRVLYGHLALEESVRAAVPDDTTAGLLADAAIKRRLHQHETVQALLNRYRFLQQHAPAPPLPDVTQAFRELARDKSTLDEMEKAVERGDLKRAFLPADTAGRFDALVPTHVSIPRRRNIPIHYEQDRPPWIASRLQDFFGLKTGPRIVDGAVPLVIHLLAPNGRDVQVTSDLAGFWERTYAGVRKSLCRQYPKHAWPEDPLKPNAAPKA